MLPNKPVDIGLWSGFTRRLMLVLVTACLLVGGLLTAASIWNQKSRWEEFLIQRGATLARSLGRAAFVPLLLEDVGALDTLTHGFSEEKYVSYVALYNAEGKELSRRPKDRILPPEEFPKKMIERRVVSPLGAEWDFVLPLRYASGEGETSGYVRIGLTESQIRAEIGKVVRNNVLLSVAVTAAAFGLSAFLIRRMTRRMRILIEEAQSSAELKRSNKELEAFSYSVSHDLRTPLRAIDGFSHALLQDYGDKLDEQGKDHLARVRSGCKRMGQLIDDLLALSRVIRQEMKRQDLDLSALARSVAEQLAQAEPERRVSFFAPPRLPARGDAGLLRIVLENLLGNAWKFTRKTEGASVSFGVMREGQEWVFFVRDNGAGFNMAYAGKLFGAFQRLHDASEFPGTGVGLATVQRIVDRHGGRIWAEGEVGRGACFYFTLKEAP